MNIVFILTLFLSPSVYSFATLPSSRSLRSSLSAITPTSLQMSSSEGDIAVVGCGVLGTSLCKQILSSPDFDGRSVTGITKTKTNHESIKEQVCSTISDEVKSLFHVCTFDDVPKDKKFNNVIFCAPPSGFDDYASAVQNAIDSLWSGRDDSGIFVFTSSGGIYGPGNGETVSESSQIPPPSSPRTQRLVDAESNTIAAGGCVLRLAGLYTLERGAHNFWLEKSGGQVKGSKDGIINLLHYDDAAGSCLAALKAPIINVRGKLFLISDGNPTTRVGICDSALKSKRYGDMSMPTFGDDDAAGRGKIYDGNWSNEMLSWKPVYPSFDEFMKNAQ